MLVVELHIIEGIDPYTAIQLLHRAHVDHIDVAVAQIALRPGKALLGGFAVPAYRLGRILGHAGAIFIARP